VKPEKTPFDRTFDRTVLDSRLAPLSRLGMIRMDCGHASGVIGVAGDLPMSTPDWTVRTVVAQFMKAHPECFRGSPAA
jgi:hypothetical protein